MIEYLVKSACCLALLLVFYHLVLEREKMHQFNRFYLLGSVLFSFIAPLFIITIQVPAEIIDIPLIYSEPVTFDNQKIVIEKPIDYWKITFGISIFISLILSIRFGLNLYKIFKKTTSNAKIKLEKAVLVLVEDTISPHTFWNYIFINKDEYHTQKIENELFTHELTHVTQKHTFDVLLIEVLKIVFWFNPLFYFLKKQIQLNHEFIADENVINSCNNISKYQYLLLNRAAWNNDYYLASNLNYSLTKKRLVMMTTKTSKVNNWLKKLAVIPLLTGSIYVFAERVETYEKVNNKEFLDAEINKGNIKTENQKINNDFFKNKSNNSSEIKSSTMSLELLEDINEKLKDANSLKMSVTEKKDTFNVNLPNGEKIKVWEDRVTDYNKLNKEYEKLRNKKPHYIKSDEERKKELDDLFSKLGSSYFKLSKAEKRNVKRPTHPMSPYVRLKKDGKIYYKLKDELTPEDKKLLPPPPQKSKKTSNSKDTAYLIKDSIPTIKRIINRKKGTFSYTTKEGKTITKKIAELTDEEKKLIPPPPPPLRLVKKPLSKKLFEELKNSKKYAIWIDGKVAKNIALNNYKNTDFYNYSGSFVHKNARSNRFPQEYQYQLNTKEYILKIKKQLPPPPPPTKAKTGFITAGKQTLYYVKNENKTTYYNRWGQQVTKKGEIINSEQTASDKVIPNQNITKVYKDDKVVSEFKQTQLPPPSPKANFPDVKKGNISNIPQPPLNAVMYAAQNKGAIFYFNGKKTSYKKLKKILPGKNEVSVLSKNVNGKKVIEFTYLANQQKQVTIDKISNLSNDEIVALPKGNTDNISYYLDDKKISKAKLDKINPDKIANISVKKNKNNTKSIFVISKK